MPVTHVDVEAIEVSGDKVTIHCWTRVNDYFHLDPFKKNTYRFDRRVVVREVRVDPALSQLYDAEEIVESLRGKGRVGLRRGRFRPGLLFDYEFSGDVVYVTVTIVPPGSVRTYEEEQSSPFT